MFLSYNHLKKFLNKYSSLFIIGFPRVHSKLELNVQVLICTDYSIYKLHESIVVAKAAAASSSSSFNSLRIVGRAQQKMQITENPVITHIKAYYTEVMDQVNERYRDSFKSDPYLNINIELVGFYIALVGGGCICVNLINLNNFFNNKKNFIYLFIF